MKNENKKTTAKNEKCYNAKPASMSAAESVIMNEAGEIHPNTFNWSSFGNNITHFIQNVTEQVTNAKAAIDKAIEAGFIYDPRRIEFRTYRDAEGYLWLTCDNSGMPAALLSMMNYGNSEQDAREHQHGTGTKTILSAENPEGMHWFIQTRDANGRYYIAAPYSPDMVVKKIQEVRSGEDIGNPGDEAIWKAEDWVTTRVACRIDDETMFNALTMDTLNMHYTFLVAKGYNIIWNGQRLTESLPGGRRTGGKKDAIVHEQPVDIQWDIYERVTEDEATVCYPIAKSAQGAYLFVNDVLYTYEDTRLFKKWTPEDNVDSDEMLKPHESMNPFVVLIRITTPANHKADIPFNNHKSAVKWDTAIGLEYRNIIDTLVGDAFRQRRREATERENRSKIDAILRNSSYNAFSYQAEVYLSPYKKEKGVETADAIIATKPQYNKNGTVKKCTRKGVQYECVDLSTATCVIEYKVVPLTPAMVNKAVGHYRAIKRYYGANTCIHFIAPAITKPAMDDIKDYQAEGIEIRISDLPME